MLDRDALTAALAGHPDIVDHGDGSYAWLEEAGAFQRSVGTIIVEDRRVVFETTSQHRAERGKEFLQRLLGDAVSFRVIAYEDVGQALKRAPARPKDKIPEILPGGAGRGIRAILRRALSQVARPAGPGSRRPYAAACGEAEDRASQADHTSERFREPRRAPAPRRRGCL